MADMLSRMMRKLRNVGHSRQNDVNDVSIINRLPGSEKALGTRFNWSSTDSISSRALDCYLRPTFPERPAFTRKVVQALIFHRLFKPTVHCGARR